MKHVTRILALVAILAIAVPSAYAGYGKKKDIVDTAIEAGNFTTLATALTEAGLVDALKGDGPFTVFAPTDEAFAKLPKGTVETLLKPENRDRLVAILKYHVISGKVKANRVVKLDAAETLNGQRVDINTDNGVTVDNANVTAMDIEARNGVIHVIDTVLLPTSETIVGVAKEAGTFKTLIAALKTAGLGEALMGEGPFTVFAPTDDAFAKLPEGTVESLLKQENLEKLQMILKYHVVSGRVFSDAIVQKKSVPTLAGVDVRISMKDGKAKANESEIVATDIDASNGVIHVLDSVLLPPQDQSSITGADLIEMAINRGAPMYNHGNTAGCAAVYEMTANALLHLHTDLPQEARMALRGALANMSRTHDVDKQAWIMRHGLDQAYEAMRMEMARR